MMNVKSRKDRSVPLLKMDWSQRKQSLQNLFDFYGFMVNAAPVITFKLNIIMNLLFTHILPIIYIKTVLKDK